MGIIIGGWYPELLGDNDEPQCTFTKQFGGYRKMGRIVYFNIDLIVDTVNLGATGPMHSTLPPYLPIPLNHVFEVSFNLVPAPVGTVKVGAWIEGSEGLYAFFNTMHYNGGTNSVDCSVLVPGASIIISGGYIAEEEV